MVDLLFSERRGWRRQLANQLTRFCAAMIPVLMQCFGSRSVFGEYKSVVDPLRDMSRAILDEVVGTGHACSFLLGWREWTRLMADDTWAPSRLGGWVRGCGPCV